MLPKTLVKHSPPPNNLYSGRWYTKYDNAPATLRFGYVLAGIHPRYVNISVSKKQLQAALQPEVDE